MRIQQQFLPALSCSDSTRPTLTARHMPIARWVIIAGLLAVGACSNATAPAQDCTVLDNGASAVSNGAPNGETCTPEQPTSVSATGNSASALGN
jgi:hypothetical protein